MLFCSKLLITFLYDSKCFSTLHLELLTVGYTLVLYCIFIVKIQVNCCSLGKFTIDYLNENIVSSSKAANEKLTTNYFFNVEISLLYLQKYCTFCVHYIY